MRLRAAIAAACLVGAGIAAYLTYVHYAHVAPICTTGGCEKVQRSKYAELAGVPVAVLGLAAYAALIVTTLRRGVAYAFASVLVALVGVAFSGYLLWAQLGPIGAVCQWCLGNDLTITVVAALTIVRMLTETDADTA
ncbi:MAG TPA: vitamin K epoxide reductase family protein [Gaiellaceae bacterium]|nr:vitamin K epoxide reductase family protein [Gaiellaceae bacterium]